MKRLTLLLFLFLAGCGSGGESEPQRQAPTVNPDAVISVKVLHNREHNEPYLKDVRIVTGKASYYVSYASFEIKAGDVVTEGETFDDGLTTVSIAGKPEAFDALNENVCPIDFDAIERANAEYVL